MRRAGCLAGPGKVSSATGRGGAGMPRAGHTRVPVVSSWVAWQLKGWERKREGGKVHTHSCLLASAGWVSYVVVVIVVVVVVVLNICMKMYLTFIPLSFTPSFSLTFWFPKIFVLIFDFNKLRC